MPSMWTVAKDGFDLAEAELLVELDEALPVGALGVGAGLVTVLPTIRYFMVAWSYKLRLSDSGAYSGTVITHFLAMWFGGVGISIIFPGSFRLLL